MKKSIIALSTMLFLAVGVANAQTEKSVKEAQQTQVVEQDKVEVSQDDLPVTLQEVLKSDRFNSWDVSKIYEVTKGKEKTYEVILMNGEKKATYKFDAEGKTIG